MAAQPVDAALGALLARLGHAQFTAEPIAAGGNNRVFRVEAGGERLLAKWYFHSDRDRRDRLRSEFSFLEHAWASGLRCVPRPLASDPQLHLGLYEFIDGRPLAAADPGAARVQEAARFFAALNASASRARAAAIPPASEACFSVAEHLAMVDARLARFSGMPLASAVEREAGEFVAGLRAAWSRHRQRILAATAEPDAPLPSSWRCLSPSDFGFHNALERPGGALCFLDFEYAGWDDPAKSFGDFFSHPGLPVPASYREAFLEAAAAPFAERAALLERSRLLEPVFQTKWCCIILNEFLPEAAERRRFAHPERDAEGAKRGQLGKAKRLAASLDL